MCVLALLSGVDFWQGLIRVRRGEEQAGDADVCVLPPAVARGGAWRRESGSAGGGVY